MNVRACNGVGVGVYVYVSLSAFSVTMETSGQLYWGDDHLLLFCSEWAACPCLCLVSTFCVVIEKKHHWQQVFCTFQIHTVITLFFFTLCCEYSCLWLSSCVLLFVLTRVCVCAGVLSQSLILLTQIYLNQMNNREIIWHFLASLVSVSVFTVIFLCHYWTKRALIHVFSSVLCIFVVTSMFVFVSHVGCESPCWTFTTIFHNLGWLEQHINLISTRFHCACLCLVLTILCHH